MSLMRRALVMTFAGVVACGAIGACADEPVSTAPGGVRAVLLRLPHDSLFWGRSVNAVAIGVGSDGALPDTRFTWTSSDTSVAVVDSLGVVTGVGTGHVTIGAELRGHRAEYSLRVVLQRADGGVSFVAGTPAYGYGQCAISLAGAVYCRLVPQSADSMPLFRPLPEPSGLVFTEVHSAGSSLCVTNAAGTTCTLGSQCGLATTGAIYCWGLNSHFIFGSRVPTTSPATGPVQVMTGSLRFSTMTLGGHSEMCGVNRDDSVLYCWGHNDEYQLGRGPAVQSDSIPAPVTGALRARTASASNFSMCLLDLAGAAYCSGGFGADANSLGVAASEAFTAVKQSTPVVGGLSFTSISVGEGFQCALTATSDAYCWGLNSSGQLGIGTTTSAPIGPQRVVGGHKFASVSVSYPSAACGLTTEGDLYCWGAFRPLALVRQLGLRAAAPVHLLAGYKFRALTRQADQICGVTMSGEILCW